MKKPRVQIKNLRFFEGHDTMQGMSGDIWIDGVKCMRVFDSAHGGCYEYDNYSREPKVLSLIKNLEDHIKTLPPQTHIFGGKTMTMNVDMDGFINDITERMQLEKQMKNKILVGVPNSTQYGAYKFKVALTKIPTTQLQASIGRIKAKLEKGEVILNTNLTALGITV
jgi:hypothetical protein